MAAFHAAMRKQCIFLAVTCFICSANFIFVETYDLQLHDQNILNHRFVRDVSSEIQNHNNTENKNASVSTPDNSGNISFETTISIKSTLIDTSNLTIRNYSSTSERSLIDPNLNSTALKVDSANNSNATGQNFSLESENSIVSTPVPSAKATSVPSESMRIVDLNAAIQNYGSITEKSNISTFDTNSNVTILQVGPTDNYNVTDTNITLKSENPSVSTSASNEEFTMVQMTFQNEFVPINGSSETLTNHSTTERSSISKINGNPSATTLQVKPTDNFDVTNRNINLGNNNPLVSIPKSEKPPVSTPAPNTDATTLQANFQTESIPTNNFDVTTINNEKISSSTTNPINDTTTIRVTVSSNSNGNINVTNFNRTLEKNSSSISPEPSPKDPKLDNSSNKWNITVDVDGRTNQTLVAENSDKPDVSEGSTSTEEISTIVKEQNCTSMLQSGLIESFTKVIIEIEAQLIDVFIDTLNGSVINIYGKLHTSNLLKFLDLIDESKNADILMNNTLSRISDMKSTLMKVINEEKIPPESNDTIWRIFREIENPLKELGHWKFRDNTLRNEVLFDITNLIKSTLNELLLGIREKAIAELYEAPAIKNSLPRMKTIVDNFLDYTQFYERKFSIKSNLFSEMILDLMEEATNLTDDFIESFQYSWIDLLLRVEEEKKLFNNLSTSVSNVLENSQKKLRKSKINQLENMKLFKNIDQLEQSFESQTSSSSDHVHMILYDSIRMSRNLLDDLRTSFENGSDSTTIYGATISIFSSLMYILQKEVPPYLDINFFNGTISFNSSELNEMFENSAENEFKRFYLCEDEIHIPPFSTSGGQFTYPFEYSLMFVLLVYYVLMR